MKKNNQAKQKFAYKNDTQDLVNLGQFLREAFNVRVEREWFIFYRDDTFVGVSSTVPDTCTYSIKTPDLMLFEGSKLICCVELDGKVHDTVAFGDTLDRNELYKTLGIPLVVINKGTLEVSMYDTAHREVEKIIKKNRHLCE